MDPAVPLPGTGDGPYRRRRATHYARPSLFWRAFHSIAFVLNHPHSNCSCARRFRAAFGLLRAVAPRGISSVLPLQHCSITCCALRNALFYRGAARITDYPLLRGCCGGEHCRALRHTWHYLPALRVLPIV